MATVHETIFGDSAWDALATAHGQSVTYTPVSGSAVTRTALFAEASSRLEYDEDGSGESGEATLVVRNDAAAGVASPVYGDAVAVGGETWRVAGISTSGATHRLSLRRWIPDEKGAGDWRVRRF